MNLLVNIVVLVLLVLTVLSTVVGCFTGQQVALAEVEEKGQNGFDDVMRKAKKLNGTVFVTMGTTGVKEGVGNVVVTSRDIGVEVVVVMLDRDGFRWCKENGFTCFYWECLCPYTGVALGSKEGYTTCLIGISKCKTQLMTAILSLSYNMFFIEPDSAARRDALNYVLNTTHHDIIAACEACIGSCALTPPQKELIDTSHYKPPTAGYYQVNIGFFWVRSTGGTIAAMRETARLTQIFVDKGTDFKSFDQTIFNRKIMASGLPTLCVPTDTSGLNVRPKTKKPMISPKAWGIHAARLVSKTGFYKKALLYVNDLWRWENVTEEFKRDVAMWSADPWRLKRNLTKRGAI